MIKSTSTERTKRSDARKRKNRSEDKPETQNCKKQKKTETEARGCYSNALLPEKNNKGQLVFKDFPTFGPNMTPKEVLQAGSFGGTYFRPIYSSITRELCSHSETFMISDILSRSFYTVKHVCIESHPSYSVDAQETVPLIREQSYKDVWKELPEDWLDGLDIPKQVASPTYRENVNTYKVKCGGSLEMWETSGWIVPQDPYGWFQWYCRFYQGRRTADDDRQIGRWERCAGVKGRWRNNLITKVVRSGCSFDNTTVSPVVRQTLQHWAYRLTKDDYEQGAKRVKPA